MRCMVPVLEGKPLAELRRGVVEHCVLALLRDGESYAFELAKVLRERDLVASEGTIYPLLARLRREELVTTAWRESNAGPPRRYYRLTGRGQTVLASFVADWTVFRDAVDALLDAAAGGTKE
jgi:PadR family transcriptional regulator PadR